MFGVPLKPSFLNQEIHENNQFPKWETWIFNAIFDKTHKTKL